MTVDTVRSRRWTVEVGPLKHLFWQEQPVECVWIDYWQRAGSDAVEVQSVSLWAKPWGEEVAQLDALDVRDRVSGWLRALIAEHTPVVAPPVDTGRTVTEYAAAERDFEDGASPSPTRELAEVEVLQNNRAGLRSHLAKREVRYGPWTEVKD